MMLKCACVGGLPVCGRWAWVVALLLVVGGCRKEMPGDPLPLLPYTIEIPGGLNVLETHYFVSDGYQPLVASGTYSAIQPAFFRLTAVDGSSLRIIESLWVYVQPIEGADSERLEVFYHENIPLDRASDILDAIPGIADAQGILTRPYKIVLRLRLRDTYLFAVPLRVSMGFQGTR